MRSAENKLRGSALGRNAESGAARRIGNEDFHSPRERGRVTKGHEHAAATGLDHFGNAADLKRHARARERHRLENAQAETFNSEVKTAQSAAFR